MSIYHKDDDTPYFFENSYAGIDYAAAHDYDEIDLDILITKDGVLVCTHWPRPLEHGFYDPWRLIKKRTRVDQMTWKQVKRLRAKWNGKTFRIRTVADMLAHCKRKGVIPRLEPKEIRYELDWPWKRIAGHRDRLRMVVRMYALRNLNGTGSGVRKVAAAKRHGIPGKVLR